MVLPSPPSSISLSQVNVELSNPGTTTISMNDAAVRTLFAKPSGAISMSDGYGKSAGPPPAPITSITVTMPHPQPVVTSPRTVPGPANFIQYNAGPVRTLPAPPFPSFPEALSNPSPNPLNTGYSCSPATIDRQFVFASDFGSPSGYLALPGPDQVATREKDVTVTYSGGPLGPGSGRTDTTALTWSVATSCPDYAPLSGFTHPRQPVAVPVRVVSTSAPKVVVDVGVGRATIGDRAPPQGPPAPNTPYPAAPGPTNSYNKNIHTRYTITGTAPAPLGGASASTSWGVVCLPLDTEVTMEDGSVKPMKDIKVGDRVKTYNPDTDEISSNEVTHLLKRHVASELIHIKLAGGIEFRATPEHECWIRRGDEGMWVMAELIEPGDSMMTEGIEYKVVESTERVEYPEGIEVGNFSVADAHVYFANKVLLHNFTG